MLSLSGVRPFSFDFPDACDEYSVLDARLSEDDDDDDGEWYGGKSVSAHSVFLESGVNSHEESRVKARDMKLRLLSYKLIANHVIVHTPLLRVKTRW
jgi:hypothetical protein